MAQIAADLSALYDGYYRDGSVDVKRDIAARDCAANIRLLLGNELGSVVDIGAGNGALLRVLSQLGCASSLTALEISSSGIERITAAAIPGLVRAVRFDGYTAPFGDAEFDTAVCAHVVEHVEHERLFLRELGRIAKRIYIEVPLEGGLRGRVDRTYGHINYYTPMSFLNLLETSGLRPTAYKVVTSSRAMEVHCYGRTKGLLRNVVRNSLLHIAGQRYAPHLMTYLLGVVCQPDETTTKYEPARSES